MSDEQDLNPIEARLRDAIGARTGRDEYMSDDRESLRAIDERVSAARRSLRNRRIGLAVVGVAAATAVVVGLVSLVNDDDGDKVATNETTTTTTEPGRPTSTTSTTAPAAAPVKAVWPFEANGVKFGTPYEAALSFAEEYLGMADPVALDPQLDGVEAVEVRPRPTAGLITHVEVTEQDGGWVVLGSRADSIKVDTPVAGDALAGPLRVAGQSTAFEATINLHFRPFGSVERVGEDNFTMGGANGEMGPFDTTIEVPDGLTEGVLVVYEGDASGEGAVSAATVIRLGVPARGEAAAPAPDRIYAWTTGAELVRLDGTGRPTGTIMSSNGPQGNRVAAAGGVVAMENSAPGVCGFISGPVSDGQQDEGPTDGTMPALSAAGDLGYVTCEGAVWADGTEYDIVPHEATGLTWVGTDIVVAHDEQFYIIGKPGTWGGTLPAGRGRYGTIAFLDTNGTIASVDPASPSRAPVPLVTPAAKLVSLDADDSGAHLLWVDVNGDLWKWSGGDPVKLGGGFTTAAW